MGREAEGRPAIHGGARGGLERREQSAAGRRHGRPSQHGKMTHENETTDVREREGPSWRLEWSQDTVLASVNAV